MGIAFPFRIPILCAALALPADAGKRILFLTTRPQAEHPLALLLASDGHAVSVVSAAAMAPALASAPDLVLAAQDTKGFWRSMNEDTLAARLGGLRVLALGSVAEQLYEMLGSDMAQGIYVFEDEVTVAVPALMEAPHRIRAPAGKVALWPATSKYAFGLPGPQAAGVEVLASADSGRTILAARQGNFAHWGFDASVARMTPEGRAFFLNVVAWLVARPDAPLPRARRAYAERGRSLHRLDKQRTWGEHRFRIQKPGTLEVRVDWDREAAYPHVHLRLIGPGSDSAVAETEGYPPLKLTHAVRPEQMSMGSDWKALVWQAVPSGKDPDLDYAIELSWP